MAVALDLWTYAGPADDLSLSYGLWYPGRANVDVLFLVGRGLTVAALLWGAAVVADALDRRGASAP